MKLVAENYDKEVLRDVDEREFQKDLSSLRKILPDRALLRAMHFFGENARVKKQIEAIKRDDIQSFLQMVTDSGESSYKKLQNIYAGDDEQGLAIALNAAEEILQGQGAWRVHGGGFAGTTLAFVPNELLDTYVVKMDSIFGEGAAAVLGIRNVGAIEIEI
jgi:galactokinase